MLRTWIGVSTIYVRLLVLPAMHVQKYGTYMMTARHLPFDVCTSSHIGRLRVISRPLAISLT